LAAAVEKELGVTTELIKSGGGAFEVFCDGKLIYSRKRTGRFPEHSEIISAIRNDR